MLDYIIIGLLVVVIILVIIAISKNITIKQLFTSLVIISPTIPYPPQLLVTELQKRYQKLHVSHAFY